ncbi:MAG TPA: cytochrome 450 [Nostocaceae cyanobacterium]|nr:cytochrome 450 [Nostocaceae cyanobacterium]
MKQTNTPSFIDIGLNNFQTWALQQPNHLFSKIFLPLISLVEGLTANIPTYLDYKRLVFGSNFCCAGQVVLGEFSAVETALTSPQARTWRLGTSMLDANHAPNLDVQGRNVFLLSLSDAEASGSTDHQAFRQCMQRYLFNEAATERQKDAIAKQLVDKLAADYLSLPHGQNGTFFTVPHQGVKGFLVRYLHYVLFGINPDDQQAIALLTDLHYTRKGTQHYITGIGSLLQRLNLLGHGQVPELIEQAATIYENSPALADFQENDPQYNAMTRRELAKLMTAIMSIAALQGPLHLAQTAMGFRPLPAYQGQKTADINVTHYWDTLDLDNRDAVLRYVLECARLWAPVSASHRVATQPFTARIAGVEQTFPAGTKVLIPMSLGLLDQSFWGSTVYEFNAQRENLCPYHMGFHSVGDRHGGRICPGKDIALNMLVDVISVVGKARRSMS